MHRKLILMASSATLAAALATTAHAQPSNTIEELVVTAERREQSLQDVPVAVSAFTSERRDLIGITTIQDMTNFTPGLQYSTQLDRTSVRGVGRLTNVHTAQGAVAIYSDGIYTSSTVEAGKTPLFTDRVEVLRGPQGTLYGRNSIGGAINVISKRPTDDWYAEVRAQVQNYDRTIIEGAVSGPTIIPGVNFRLAGNWDKQREGWIDNIVPGMPDEGNVIDSIVAEGQLSFEFGDNFEGWLKLATYRWEHGGGGPGSRYTWTPFPYPTYQAANAAIALNPGYACRPGLATNVVNPSPMGCVNPAINDPRKIASIVPYDVDLDSTVIFASEWIWHFDTVDLKYLAGGTHYHYYLNGPTPVEQAPIREFRFLNLLAPGTPGALVRPRYEFSYEEIQNWISHEVNLSSTHDGALQWLAGVYLYFNEFEQPVSTYLPDEPASRGAFLTQATCIFTGNACAAPIGRIYDNRPKFNIQSKAIFGQADWQFAETWKLTAGLRYTRDDIAGTESLRLLCFDVQACSGGFPPEIIGNNLIDLTQLPTVISGYVPGQPGAPGVTPGVSSLTRVDPASGFASRDYENSWTATTGTLGVQWEPDSDTMAYGRYSRGYKAGALRVGIDTVISSSPNSEPEYADAFEVGLKKNFGSTLQTNIAVFHTKYENAQVPISIVPTGGGLAQVQSVFYNIPKAVTQGVEVEATWLPIDNLQILFNYSYLDARITEALGVIDPVDPTAVQPGANPVGPLLTCAAAPAGSCDVFTGNVQRGQNLDGNHLPNAPEHKFTFNVNYTWQIGPGSLTASASYIWRDEQYGSIFDREYYKSPSYDQVDLRATWKDADDRYSVIAFVRNAFDEIGYEGGAGASRRAGFVPAFALGQAGFAARPVVEGIASTYPLTPPRTFGVELQYRFF
jgi:iron complex outermembrane recepter protein